MKIHEYAGKHLPEDKITDIDKLIKMYYSEKPDMSAPETRVSFGTSGHRGSSFKSSFTESHILAITQAICDYRKKENITGPVFIGYDTHALSRPAFETALEVLAANETDAMIADNDYIYIYVDTDKIVRVMDNLLKNAVNYSYPSTTISIDLKKKDKKCICTITNHGKTIPKDKLNHIFERFYRVDDDDLGTGLGLVIVKQIIEMHHGKIRCESSDEKVRFIFTLPVTTSTDA